MVYFLLIVVFIGVPLVGVVKQIKKKDQNFLEAEESPMEAIPQSTFIFMEPPEEKDDYGVPELVKIFNETRKKNKKRNNLEKHRQYITSEARNINFRTELGKLHQANLEQNFPEAVKAKQTRN